MKLLAFGVNKDLYTCPRTIHPNETVGAVPACLPNVRAAAFPYQKCTHCARGMNDECALAGRHGRAHRHRPYQSPSYFSTQPHTNKITIYVQSTPTASNTHTQSTQTKHVGAVPACPPERSRSGVSIPKIHALCAGDERRMRPCRATRAGT